MNYICTYYCCPNYTGHKQSKQYAQYNNIDRYLFYKISKRFKIIKTNQIWF